MAENCNECSIAWMLCGDDYAEVSACNGSKLKGRVLKLAEQYPDDVKIIATYKDGSILAYVQLKYVPNLRVPKNSQKNREQSLRSVARICQEVKQLIVKNRQISILMTIARKCSRFK